MLIRIGRIKNLLGVSGGDALKHITIELPAVNDELPTFYTVAGFTVKQLHVVVTGGAPSVTWTLRYSLDRSLAGTVVHTETTTNTTTGVHTSPSGDADIPVGAWYWLEVTAIGGTPVTFNLTIEPA